MCKTSQRVGKTEYIKNIPQDVNFVDKIKPISTAYYFCNLTELSNIENINDLNTLKRVKIKSLEYPYLKGE